MPRSTKNSSTLGTLLASSPAMWGGLRWGWSIPLSACPSAVVTTTRWETMFAGSWPPKVWSLRKPLSSMCLTRKPISSVWAATMTRTPSSRPFLVPITLPRASVRTSSVRPPSSSRAISLCCSSRPGTPGVSINRFNSASFKAMPAPPDLPEIPRKGYQPTAVSGAKSQVPNAKTAGRTCWEAQSAGLTPLALGLLLQATGFEHLGREVEAQAEVVEEVEEGEGQDQGVRVGHLPEDRGVAPEPERGEGEREPPEDHGARRVDVAYRHEDEEGADHEHRRQRPRAPRAHGGRGTCGG